MALFRLEPKKLERLATDLVIKKDHRKMEKRRPEYEIAGNGSSDIVSFTKTPPYQACRVSDLRPS